MQTSTITTRRWWHRRTWFVQRRSGLRRACPDYMGGTWAARATGEMLLESVTSATCSGARGAELTWARGWWISRLPRSLRLSCSEPSTQLAFLVVPWMPVTRLSEPHDAKGHYPAGHRPRGKRRRMRRRPAGGEVVQAGESPAPRRAGSLVGSRGKLGSQDRFLGAAWLVEAS
jgi:hypothetical protein